MKFKNFHITDFPENEIYIKLNQRFTKTFFDNAIQKAGSQNKLAKYIQSKQQAISSWRNWKVSFSLRILNKLIKFSEYKNLKELEENIFFLKGRIHGYPLYNPALPLNESEKLMKLLAHLIGDGYGGTYKSQGNYYDIDLSMRKEFIKNIRIFGNVPIKTNNNEIKFPRFIAAILEKIYKISFYTMEARVPKILFGYPKNYKGAFLRAFCDDEAWVGDKKIEIYSKNKLLLKDIKKLLKSFKIKVGKIEPVKRANRIRITSEYFRIFNKFIGFDYPKKKEQLEFNLKLLWLNNRRGKFQSTKNNILKLLSKPMTTTQLSRRLFISESTIRDKHLKQLNEKGLISVVGKKNRSFVWSVK